MRNLFSGGFKDNQHLSFGFLTGILRVAKESIFSGMNNLSINSVLDNKYSAYFGFTADEVMEMAEYYGAADKYDEICQWYDGYRFGKTEIFNPWSVVNYFSNECEPRPFWVSTGSNDIIGEVLAQADEEIYNRLTSLVNGETFTTFIDTGVIYPQIKSNPSTIYSFLLVTGYLKALKTTPSFSGDFMCEVSLPNREISLVYNKEILQRLENLIPPSTVISVQEAIFSGDNARLKAQIQTLLTQSVSSFDTAGENFYHGFMLGLCALLGGASEEDCRKLRRFAIELGLAFQLQDDLLDSYGDERLGKAIGGDILEGKQTYLMITAISRADEPTREVLRSTHRSQMPDAEKIATIKAVYDRLDIPRLTEQQISLRFERALGILDTLSVEKSRTERMREYALSLMGRKN